MIHCKKCLTVFTNSVGSGYTLCNECRAKARIKALEAERDKAVELLRELIKCCTHCETYRMLGYLSHCEKCQDVKSFLASIGGEDQP